MLFRAIGFAAAALAWGQPVPAQSKVFQLAFSESSQADEELATIIRFAGHFQPHAVVASSNAISVSGNASQVELAQWVIGELDKPAVAPLPANSAEHQYRTQDGSGDIVKVIHLAHSKNRLDLLEVMTSMRVITELHFMQPYHPRQALVFRGTSEQILLAGWVAGELDWPVDGPLPSRSDAHQYLVKDGTGDVARLSYVANAATPQSLQEVMTLIRTLTDIRHLFPLMTRKVLSWRGTADQIQMVEWLIGELDKPDDAPLSPNSAGQQYRVQDNSGEIVRVFYLAQAKTPRDLDEVMTLLRTVTDMRRAFPYRARKALGFRGAPDQMRLGEWLVNTLEKPPGSGQFQMAAGDEQVSVFFLPPSRSSKELQDLFGSVRTATEAPQMFFTEAQKAIAIRGTAAQIATAKRMIEQP